MDELLQTKLFLPESRLSLIPRPRLIQKLDSGLEGRLTLISAPAGFGKTTVVTDWLTKSRQNDKTAWLSLDEEDNNPNSFLSYFIAAIQTVFPKIGESAFAVLQSSQPPLIESILKSLINEMTPISDQLIVVLDDYHLIDSQPIDHALTFLIENLPAQAHLIITTREDPNFPLHRLRARRQLSELRAADLRFTADEGAQLLNKLMGLSLSSSEINTLLAHTEGWVTGLQLAAVALQGREDAGHFIDSFTGDHRFVLDYLVEEVLKQQPDSVRNFLVQTSILNKLNGRLCDVVIGHDDSSTLLISLELKNLFVIPLDDHRQWYRYHHLFSDVLQAYARSEMANSLPTLHRRASNWYEQNGFVSDAIHHALAGEHFEQAATLIEQAWHETDMNFQSTTWLNWARLLPDALIQKRPLLSASYAWALLACGQMEGSEKWLSAVEAWIKSPPTPIDEVVSDKDRLQSLPASIATARAYQAMAIGDIVSTIKFAEQALDQPDQINAQWHRASNSLLGLAQFSAGHLKAAEHSLINFQLSARQSGKVLEEISITFTIASIKLSLGHLNGAVRTYEQMIQTALKHSEPPPLGTADLYRGISELSLEQGNLDKAIQHFEQCQQLGNQITLTDWEHRVYATEAQILAMQGDLEGALNLFNQAEKRHIRTPLPTVRPVAAQKVRLWLKLGNLTDAEAWVSEQHLAYDDPLSYMQLFNYLTLARVMLEQYKRFRAEETVHNLVHLLARLRQTAESNEYTGILIEILILQALTEQAQGNSPDALTRLKNGLMLAEPEKFIRLFTEHASPMAKLLARVKPQVGNNIKLFIDKILADIERQNGRFPTPPTPQPLIDPLSSRELEVLHLIAQGRSNREISQELFLALSTIKGHNRIIFSKLHVQNRTEAVARARELGLL
ncbi:MAG: LuxR C-terminal-related transcriptional regulator [Chloroflexota bacterium]